MSAKSSSGPKSPKRPSSIDGELQRPPYWSPVKHSMHRRNQHNNYHRAGRAYMITLTVEDRVKLLSRIEGTPEVPHIVLTDLGCALKESWLALPAKYPEVTVHESESVIMPEHFHGILYVTQYMEAHLSDVVRSLKGRINTAYRLLLIEGKSTPVGMAVEWYNLLLTASPADRQSMHEWLQRYYDQYLHWSCDSLEKMPPPPIVLPRSKTNGSKLGFLLSRNYCDTQPLNEEELDIKIHYVQDNARQRLLKHVHHDWLNVQRRTVSTAMTSLGLESYLYRPSVCGHYLQHLSAGEAGVKIKHLRQSLLVGEEGYLWCDSFGNLELLQQTLYPIVCHRADLGSFIQQRNVALRVASEGAVLVSACIAEGEQTIINDAQAAGYPIIRIMEQGFDDSYHPSSMLRDLCAQGLFLCLTPWIFEYGRPLDPIFSKSMNAVAQALCRIADDWWKLHV